MLAANRFASVSDPLELVSEHTAVAIPTGVDLLLIEYACEHTRAEHRRREPRSFFIGPVDDFDGMIGLDSVIVERANDFESSEYAEDSVELPAGGLRVEVAANCDRV